MSKLTLLAFAACAMATGARAAEPAVACPPVTAFSAGMDHLDGYRFYTGPDGDTAVEPLRIQAKQIPLLKTGKLLGMFALPKAPNREVQIVVGPANMDLPLHAAPYPEMFIMLAGSTDVTTSKFHARVGPGSVLLFEDVDAKIGHGGRTGPCGYISLSVAP